MAGREVVIVGAARTPIGSFLGSLAAVPAPRLGAVAIRAALERAGVEPGAVDEVVMGNVLQAGVGQAPARQAALLRRAARRRRPAGRSTRSAARASRRSSPARRPSRSGDAEVVVAGGMESMSNVPYYDRAAAHRRPDGQRRARGRDDPRRPLGRLRQHAHGHLRRALRRRRRTSRRAAQDEFALESTRRAIEAQKDGAVRGRDRPGGDRAAKKGEKTVVARGRGPEDARAREDRRR